MSISDNGQAHFEQYEIVPLPEGGYHVQIYLNDSGTPLAIGNRATFEEALLALKMAKEATGR